MNDMHSRRQEEQEERRDTPILQTIPIADDTKEKDEEKKVTDKDQDQDQQDVSAFEEVGLTGTDLPPLFQRGSLNNQTGRCTAVYCHSPHNFMLA
jgi:hypothetical protein